MIKNLLTWLTGLAMIIVPLGAVEAKTRYAKSEMDKAVGNCVGSVIGGALLGAVLGRVIGGRNAVAGGAGIGVGVGGIVCALLISNARHRDDIIEAQMAALQNTARPSSASWTDDEGKAVSYTARASTATFDGSQLLPVKYDYRGAKVQSPELPAGNADCRTVSGTASNGGNSPGQIWCRNGAGDWFQYGARTT